MWNARSARNVRALNRVNEKAAAGKKLTKREKALKERAEKKAPEFAPFIPR